MTTLLYVSPALSREVAADGYELTVSFLRWGPLSSTSEYAHSCYLVVSKEILHLSKSAVRPRQNIKSLAETLLSPLSPPSALDLFVSFALL
jgi:hypothetical protein